MLGVKSGSLRWWTSLERVLVLFEGGVSCGEKDWELALSLT